MAQHSGLMTFLPIAPTGPNLKAQGKRSAALGWQRPSNHCPERARSRGGSGSRDVAPSGQKPLEAPSSQGGGADLPWAMRWCPLGARKVRAITAARSAGSPRTRSCPRARPSRAGTMSRSSFISSRAKILRNLVMNRPCLQVAGQLLQALARPRPAPRAPGSRRAAPCCAFSRRALDHLEDRLGASCGSFTSACGEALIDVGHLLAVGRLAA